jgi:ABC-2 type transport system ATP-binding protein
MTTPLLSLRNVRKAFKDQVAVDCVSFDVRRGEIFGFLGPNGAGKTTTLRMILGITQPDAGVIEFEGSPHVDRARVGYLPEERGLFEDQRVLDTLAYLGELRGMSTQDARAAGGRWLEKLGLADRAKSKLQELSKGMQQKIQFIATIVHDPEILILDEPFSGLDPINVALMRDYFLEFRAQGKTIVFSTHVLEQAEKLCDEIGLLAKSRKILDGSLRELKRRYSQNLIRISIAAQPNEVAELPGVVSCHPLNGSYVISLAPGTDENDFLRRTLERYRVDAFSRKEPELEEIYLQAVQAAGIEDTRTVG